MGFSRSWSLSPVIAALVFSIASVPADARRPPGALDRSFGAGGKVVTDVFGGGDEPSDIAVQSDGKLVVSTLSQRSGGDPRALVLRYHADGRLDPSFGDGGRAAVEVPGAQPGVTPVALAIQADGRIVVVSKAILSGGTKTALTRLSPNGSPDATYGDGGTQVTTLGADNQPTDLGLQPDGKVVVVASVQGERDADLRLGLLRFEPDGDPDPTLDGDGRAIAPLASGFEIPTALAVRTDGRILVASSLGRFFISLVRFLADGRPDSAFGEGGRVVHESGFGEYPSISDLALRPNGASLGLGTNSAPLLMAFTPEGELDGNFGSGGAVRSGALTGRAAALDALGAAVVVGPGLLRAGDFAVARYTRRGRLDRGFGRGGLVQTDVGPRDDEPVAVALQTDGKIVVLGLDRPLSLLDKPSDIEVARYWGGYDRGKPRIRIRGVPRRRCLRRRRRVRIRISDLSALSRVHVRLDGRRLRATRKRRFSIRLRPSRLRPGRHRLSVIARDVADNRGARRVRFKRCPSSISTSGG